MHFVFNNTSSGCISIFLYCFFGFFVGTGFVSSASLSLSPSLSLSLSLSLAPPFVRSFLEEINSALYPKCIPFATNADDNIFAPKLEYFKSEKIKCLNFLPYCFSSRASSSSILFKSVSNFGERFEMSFSNVSFSNDGSSNLYTRLVLDQFDFFRTHSGSKDIARSSFIKFSISLRFSAFTSILLYYVHKILSGLYITDSPIK